MARTGIVVLHWKNTEEVRRILTTLGQWSHLDFKIVLVDNSGDFGEDQSISNLDVIRPGKNTGFGGGCNLGMKEAFSIGCNYVLLLNADVEMAEGDAREMVRSMEVDEHLAAVAPRLKEWRKGAWEIHDGGLDPLVQSNTRMNNPDNELKIKYLPGTALLLNKTAVLDNGFFNEKYFFSGEVADWFLRLNKKIWKFELLKSVMIHHLNRGNELFRKTDSIYYSLRNRYLLIQDHGGTQRKQLKRKWTRHLWRQYMGALLRLQFARSGVVRRAIRDGSSGYFGEKKQVSS